MKAHDELIEAIETIIRLSGREDIYIFIDIVDALEGITWDGEGAADLKIEYLKQEEK
jgi:hypothetical protein